MEEYCKTELSDSTSTGNHKTSAGENHLSRVSGSECLSGWSLVLTGVFLLTEEGQRIKCLARQGGPRILVCVCMERRLALKHPNKVVSMP